MSPTHNQAVNQVCGASSPADLAAALGEPAPPAAAHPRGEELLKPLVFVVDDDLCMGALVDFCLQSAGCRTMVFQNPLLAVQSLATLEVKPVLLVSDFNMPEMDGLHLLEQCKALAPALRTIILSGSLAEDTFAGHQSRPDAVLEKPVGIDELVTTTRRLLASPNTSSPSEPAIRRDGSSG
jgi:CheY-like chemotaxis protein